MSDTYTNRLGWTFRDGIVTPPTAPVATSVHHTFDPNTSEPQHANAQRPYHCNVCRTMETMGVPNNSDFRYVPGQFVYVHEHAYNTNPMDALECVIEDVTDAPLRILVTPCNHPELSHYVRQDQLSAPIMV